MPFWTIRLPRVADRVAALVAAAVLLVAPHPAAAELQIDPTVLYKQMKAAYDKGVRDNWPYVDETDYFSAVLDAGRAYELKNRDSADNATIKGFAFDLATRLHYDPLLNRDAAEWYVRLAAQAAAADPQRAAAAQALIARLDAEAADTARLASDAEADSQANIDQYPRDLNALIDQVDLEVRAFALTRDTHYRALALAHAAQPTFPISSLPAETNRALFRLIDEARAGGAGFSDGEREAARVAAAHHATTRGLQLIGRVLSHQTFLVITAPADEYFGRTKLSPIGVRNELQRINNYLDAGWGARMSGDALWVVDSLTDWQHQYPRDYELPRLYKRVYDTLARIDTPQAHAASTGVRHVLTVDYSSSSEARSLLSS